MEPEYALPLEPQDSNEANDVNEANEEIGMQEALPMEQRALDIEESPTSECETGQVYVVQQGDTYEQIAASLGLSILELFELNPYLDPSRMEAGQTLCIPAEVAMTTVAVALEAEPLADIELAEQRIGIVPPIGTLPPEMQLPNESNQTPPTLWNCPSSQIGIILPNGWTYVNVLRYYNVSFQALVDANPQVVVEQMRPGTRLCIPPSGSRGMCVGNDIRSYIMGNNETLDTIAWQSGISVGRILMANPYLAPNDFVGGRTICLPIR